MQLVEVQLTKIAIDRPELKLGRLDDDELIDLLVSCWRHNGQVLGREHPIHRFDFKCDRCLLLSNIAMSLP
jgi:predicted  nucleic acid-binding Zn ribbon protein